MRALLLHERLQVGIVPGPSGPDVDSLHRLMRPVVEEIKQYYTGNQMHINGLPTTVWAVLVLVACDSPAMRALLGFTGHASYETCTKCRSRGTLVKKPGATVARPYNPDIAMEAAARTREEHVRYGAAWSRANTSKARDDVVSQHGYRLCIFLELPYFDSIRHQTFDPLHSLLLGTLKDFFKQMTAKGLIDTKKLAIIQERGDQLLVPREVRSTCFYHWPTLLGGLLVGVRNGAAWGMCILVGGVRLDIYLAWVGELVASRCWHIGVILVMRSSAAFRTRLNLS